MVRYRTRASASYGALLHIHALLAQRHLLGHRGLDHVGPHPHVLHIPHVNAQAHLDDRDDLFTSDLPVNIKECTPGLCQTGRLVDTRFQLV